MGKIVIGDLVGLIFSLEKDEKKQIRTFFDLSFGNILKNKGQPNAIVLFDYLTLLKDNPIPEKSVLQHAVYGKPIPSNIWNVLVGNLYRAITKYIVLNQLNGTSLLEINEVAGHLLNRGKLLAFNRLALQQIQMIQAEPRNHDFHHKLYETYRNLEIYHKDNIDGKSYLEPMYLHLDQYQLENKLALICELTHRAALSDQKYELSSGEKEVVKQAMKSNDQVIRMYYLTYLLLSLHQYEFFADLQRHLENQKTNFAKDYLKPFFEYLLNYCIKEVKRNNISCANDYLQIISEMEKRDMLLEKNQISWQRFKNIVTAYLYCNRTNALELFISRYSDKLTGEYKASSLALANARVLFKKRKPKQVQKTVKQIEFKNPIERIECDKLMLKISFQLMTEGDDEIESLTKKIESSRKYLYRKKKESNSILTDDEVKRAENFVFHIRKLAKAATKERVLHPRIETDNLYESDRIWLEQQVK